MRKAILMILVMLTVLIPLRYVEANQTIMYVEPHLSTVEIFTTFKINISVSQVVDLAAWEFKLYYKNAYLNATQIQEGSFLKTAGETSFFIKEFNDTYNATHGRIWAFCTLLGQGSGATGNGTLAMITFKAKLNGIATLKLAETDMLDSEMPPNHINHTTADGKVKILGHDIAVTNVNPLKTIVGQNLHTSINVTIENQGDFTEIFNATVYANTTLIETKKSTLTNGSSTILTFSWNTSGFAKGIYILWVYAWPVPSEIDTGDNTCVSGVVTVTIQGDIDGDFDVDIYDVVKITGIYGFVRADPEFNPNSDLDEDGEITIYDVVMCTSHYGEIDP